MVARAHPKIIGIDGSYFRDHEIRFDFVFQDVQIKAAEGFRTQNPPVPGLNRIVSFCIGAASTEEARR